LNIEEDITLSGKQPSKGKYYFDQRKALQSAPSKSAKITSFLVLFRLGQTADRKNI